MAAVVFEQVRKTFGATEAIPGLDLAIETGEFVALLGPSGCGKTTMLRMLAGLERADSGRILIDGRDVTEVAPGARDIAMVFQSYALYPHMTVAENIAYPLRKRGVSKSDRAGHVDKVAALLQLGDLLNRKPRELSGGQQQRVALGRALVREPKVFLLDEPLSNLDAKLRSKMRAELIELHRRLGKTMVYVTHDQLEAMTMSNRIAVIRGGVVQQFAVPLEIYQRPANAFVAEFIGSPAMTLVEGHLAFVGDAMHLTLGTASFVLPAGFVAAAPADVQVGVRPEDVMLGRGDAQATVRVVEPTGHETLVIIDAHGVPLTARLAGDTTLRPGDRVSFALRAERIHLFARDDGRRLNADVGPIAAATI